MAVLLPLIATLLLGLSTFSTYTGKHLLYSVTERNPSSYIAARSIAALKTKYIHVYYFYVQTPAEALAFCTLRVLVLRAAHVR